MANFFKDNRDLQFTLDHLDLAEAVKLREANYTFAEQFETAPTDYADAMDNYRRLLDVIGEICGDNIEPRSRTVDQEGPHFADGVVTYHPLTRQNLADLAKADVMGVMLPHQYGGLNFPVTIYTMMTEMVSRADASLQNLFGLQDIAETICEFGSEEQRQEFLPRFATGEVDGSMDLTEPDSGSDLQSVRLRAWQDPKTGQWYLNGMKRFITNGCAQVHLVLARSEDNTTDGRGLSMFICEAGPKLVVRRIENKLGIHGVATCELQYNDVPAQLCGQRRRGLTRYVMSLMNGARVAISAQALGVAEAAYREARKYASEREQFKKSIDQFPAIYDMLCSMKSKILAARTLLYETTRAVDLRNGYNHLVEHSETVSPEDRAAQKYYNRVAAVLTPMCKALSTEIANQVAYDSIQIHGGTGYMRDFNAERFYRDARITNIYEGTTQLQVVAAIGGVIQRDNDKRIAELFALPYTGKLARLKEMLGELYAKHLEAVRFVADKRCPEYHDLMARHLVDMETYVFVGLLMLRDACHDAERVVLAERYILDAVPEFTKRHLRVMSDDVSVIDSHREVIEY
ncbi:acyl-CoA dehydrogenase family protein [Victivallis sp. Marseille-Q1083]|uniref:acyl-CoA dehydrogenase family protein n=1 Tax=Victivallis sp. Marseille-Q1083 TaxID=2717288 RepID=UPI00158C08C9|nr:acyl-CoA dehydrogenase family protein [Victivallis sp. Marseille-Q1083]